MGTQRSIFEDTEPSVSDGQDGVQAASPQSDLEQGDVDEPPQEWQEKRLRDLIRDINAGYSAKSRDRAIRDGEIGVLKVSAATHGTFKPEEHKVVLPEATEDVKVSPRAGDLIMARSSGTESLVGACVYVKRNYSDLYLPDTLWQVEVEEDVSARWLNHALASERMRARIQAEAYGTSRNNKLSMKRLRGLRISVPPPDEQQEIAEILDAWDHAIEQVEDLIEEHKRRLHGLRQRLLNGEVRFPTFDDPWVQTTLGEYFQYFSDRNSDEQDLPVLSCSKVHGIIPQSEKFDQRVASKDTSKYKIVERGDLVYDPMLLWDTSIGFVDCVDQGVVSPAYYTFKFNEEKGDRDFFRHLLATDRVQYQYKAISQGTNQRRRKAPKEAFLGIEVKVPSLPEQREIAEVMRSAEAEIEALKRKRDALKRQKKGLMQRLLTGAIRTV